jgi:hypothetical protein
VSFWGALLAFSSIYFFAARDGLATFKVAVFCVQALCNG